MIYIVLGMHKSGTTLVAEILHRSGINMGNFPTSIDYDKGNKLERHETQEINRELLSGHLLPKARHLLSVLKNPKFNGVGYRFNSDSTAILIREKALKRKLYQDGISQKTLGVIDSCENQHEHWGFKDPRTCLTYGFWQRAIPEHRIIVIYRNYENLLQRFKSPKSIGRYRVINSWRYHNEYILEHMAITNQPHLIIEYDLLMNDDAEYARLQNFVGLPLTDARKETFYRNKSLESGISTESNESNLLKRLRDERDNNILSHRNNA